MIGQQYLVDMFSQIDRLPNFMIFVGSRGSGKKTFIREYIGGTFVGISVNDVRTVVDLSYKVHDTVFVFADADNMSLAAKNALLKVIEECPNNNKYILTLEDENNTLDTIKSRAMIWYMFEYSAAEILEYCHYIGRTDPTERELIKDICDTPGDVNLFLENGGTDFYLYVRKVVEYIHTVSGSNAFKIADKISMKEDDGKYDLKLFWKIFMKICVDKFVAGEDVIRFSQGCKITSGFLRDLRIKGINKQALFDSWILSIRDAWYLYE